MLDNLPEDWNVLLKDEFSKDYMHELSEFLRSELDAGKEIYPSRELWFNAFKQTPLKELRCVIIGQDPYFSKPHQAHGLAFSVPEGIVQPPSLKNILKELESDLDVLAPVSGDLSPWARRGVLLLNASLTVEAGSAGSHLDKGWMEFTKAVIEAINHYCENIVFLSWGAFAHKLTHDIDTSKHAVIMATHPSPLGARRPSKSAPAFIGSKCFSNANNWLQLKGLEPIDWNLS